VIKSRRMIWAEHIAHMGDTRNAYKILVENLKERDCKTWRISERNSLRL
jgi:hypothetical protein